jgi:hypothetical protein
MQRLCQKLPYGRVGCQLRWPRCCCPLVQPVA